jgi:hypothetical protein
MPRHHALVLASALSLAGCAATETVETPQADAAETQVETPQDASPEDVFAHYDENGDGALSATEFQRAFRFNPERDCNFRSDVINDPRCDPFRSRRGPTRLR